MPENFEVHYTPTGYYLTRDGVKFWDQPFDPHAPALGVPFASPEAAQADALARVQAIVDGTA